MSRKKMFLKSGSGVLIPTYITGSVNTFIGARGDVITSAADLAARVSIVEANITNFQIDDNNNIACFIDTDYTITVGFNLDTTISYWIDLDNHLTNVPNRGFFGTTAMKIFYARDSATLAGNNSRQFRQSACNIWYSHTTTLGNNTHSQQIFLSMVAPATITFFANVFLETSRANVFARASIGCAGVLAGDFVTVNGLVYTGVTGVKADNTEFSVDVDNNTVAEDLEASIGADTRTGTIGDVSATSALNNPNVTVVSDILGTGGNVVTLATSNATRLTITSSLFTGGVDAGGIEGDLVVAQSAGSTLKFVDPATDLDTPPVPTAISATSITATGADINFTAPTTTYTILKYEVWINGTFHDWIDVSGDPITGLASNTVNKLKLVTCDIFYNRSVLSSEIIVTTLEL